MLNFTRTKMLGEKKSINVPKNPSVFKFQITQYIAHMHTSKLPHYSIHRVQPTKMKHINDSIRNVMHLKPSPWPKKKRTKLRSIFLSPVAAPLPPDRMIEYKKVLLQKKKKKWNKRAAKNGREKKMVVTHTRQRIRIIEIVIIGMGKIHWIVEVPGPVWFGPNCVHYYVHWAEARVTLFCVWPDCTTAQPKSY